MKPFVHLFWGSVASLVLYFLNFNLTGIFLFWIASWLLIDLDHFLYTIVKEREYLPHKIIIKTFSYSESRSAILSPILKKHKYPLFVFHGIEFLFLIFIFSIFFSLVYFILAGFLFHLILDYLDIYFNKKPLFSKISIIYILIRNKNKSYLLYCALIHKVNYS